MACTEDKNPNPQTNHHQSWYLEATTLSMTPVLQKTGPGSFIYSAGLISQPSYILLYMIYRQIY